MQPKRLGWWLAASVVVLTLLATPRVATGDDRSLLDRQPVVRVGVLVDTPQAFVSCAGKIRVWRRGTGLRASTLGPGIKLRLLATRMAHSVWEASTGSRTVTDWGIALSEVRAGRLGVFAEELIFEPVSPGMPLRIDGRAYRGEVIVQVSQPNNLTVINAVHIEDYLCGVVPAEIGGGEEMPPAALEAQAIAARSYALFHLGRHPERDFDLYDGVEDQMYGGTAVETPAGTQAVYKTSGVLATYERRPIRANYCSTCGGITAESGQVWPGEDFAYLRPTKSRGRQGEACCAASSHFRWEESWGCEELERTILEHLYSEVPEAKDYHPTQIRDVRVTKRTKTGRAQILRIKTDSGEFEVRGDRIRWVLRRPNGSPLRSTWFDRLERSHQSACRVTLKGAGYGHGVGLCQTGTIELGRQGLSAPEILRHYYRGIDLEKWW